MLLKLIEEIRNFEGIKRKSHIKIAMDILKNVQDFGKVVVGIGDDAAVLKSNGGYLLFSADGVLPALVREEPYAAGKASVMVNVNDIYAMGGRPVAMVNVVASKNIERISEILKGIAKGCEKFRVPMVGGHLHPDAEEDSLVVSIVGTAKRLLLSSNAKPGDKLIFAVDLKGRVGCKTVRSWDSTSCKSSEDVVQRLEILCDISEEKLCEAAKDVSMGGVLGTIAMLLESSGVGGDIFLDDIPKPAELTINEWLKAFMSYGFILSVNCNNTEKVLNKFQEKEITASIIGEVKEGKVVEMVCGEEREVLFDFNKEGITGSFRDGQSFRIG
ncbi:MAG: hypothetical protein A3C43_12515 [Candidatus Schekmanbacteria bacterium RIFCSPHIGHO2_02_FULL_38_11]|uniref:Methanogenesis marker 2 protein n=1 Tax=Candidatus Schekmanbacteria bacterium RIFCSPLOWO2_12_FULL_38_15 TaxID=1817883 RepID=A0A1F7SJM6_9BACT|nr:MAG: hypothetical protein A2043_04110 [Candidatus Schekmanbacteria bacterium GWA2_38_9]OGL50833.1 MAG: hypothetical protein A3H37_03205 [Candidatus Schekmanbacteria bacterium RIFCSPLOWO2_02_FULL_38_14]OGL53407.1 MAG: hypothetical protein A3G31_07860 [Candidatus Schekmanbacteria bacterium RIFCSPLOWO2_12_FULL_38_15]OGL55759.1 MAG: hypothetical protein A3C43_12515 [Candidatus Schekmanbacteria bacterium RIFCSPHIGHO2_02_FULL_38_11]